MGVYARSDIGGDGGGGYGMLGGMPTSSATPKPAKLAVQPEFLLPGEPALAHCGEMTPQDRAELVLEAVRDCPTMLALTEEGRRWAVVQAFADRATLGVERMAEIAGVSVRTAYRLLANPKVQSAVCDVIQRMAPPGFVMLRSVAAEAAQRLAGDLRFGRRHLDGLCGGERMLLDLALAGNESTPRPSRATVTTPDGTVVEVEAGSGEGSNRLGQARSLLRERLLGRGAGESEGEGCQSVPGRLPGAGNGGAE